MSSDKSEKGSARCKRIAKRLIRVVARAHPPVNLTSPASWPGGLEDAALHIIWRVQQQGLTPASIDAATGSDGEDALDAIAIIALLHFPRHETGGTHLVQRLSMHADLSAEWRRVIQSTIAIYDHERKRVRRAQRQKERENQLELADRHKALAARAARRRARLKPAA